MGNSDVQVSSIMNKDEDDDETIMNDVDYPEETKGARIKKICICTLITLVVLIASHVSTWYITYKNTYDELFPKSLTHEFDDRIEEIEEINIYDFMPIEMCNYICEMCKELGIDPDLSVSILLNENPEFDVNATHRNDNGTIDVGLWQLNDRYLWTIFRDSYWKFDKIDKNNENYVELDPFNWKHNTYIALHLIQDLSKSLKCQDDIIMAYNAGIGRVMNGDIPTSTLGYLNRARINYELLTQRLHQESTEDE